MPPNPPQLAVIDHMNFASGKDVTAFTTWSDALLVASREASGDACMNRLIWLWSSIGASSTNQMPSDNSSTARAATCSESRVLPQPPVPSNVTIRLVPSNAATDAISCSRPMNEVS